MLNSGVTPTRAVPESEGPLYCALLLFVLRIPTGGLTHQLHNLPVDHPRQYVSRTGEQTREPMSQSQHPGSAWLVLAGHRLKKKGLLEGRRARYNLLLEQGIVFEQRYSIEKPPTHDQLDAALAAYIAYLFKNGKTSDYGRNPSEDASVGILREGLILQPVL